MSAEPKVISEVGSAREQCCHATQSMRGAEHAALAQGGGVMRRAAGRTSMCQELGTMRRAGPGG